MNFTHTSPSGFHVHSFSVGPLGCNCSIICDPETSEAVLVDPGDDFSKIQANIETIGAKIKYIVHTHAHFDHIGASRQAAEASKAPLYLHPEDRFLWENMSMQGKMFGMTFAPQPDFTVNLEDELEMRIGKHSLKTLFTPGHTPGSCSFHIQDILFSGDTLFQRSIGRTDLWGGDFSVISRSIKERLYSLDGDTVVVCGHGPNTRIGVERKTNPFVSL